ncbi:MAG: immunoglobulin domain-containing protein [Opitutaceae bacterium]
MKLIHQIHRRLHWLNIPGALLIALLQRTPVMRVAATAESFVAGSPLGAVLRSAFAAASALGAMHSLAGATQFVINIGNPIRGTVGQPIQSIGFTYTGTPSSPARFQITAGSLPPGLSFIPAASPSGLIFSGTPFISGTPTEGGGFDVFVQGFNAEGLTNGEQVQISFEIAGPSNTPPSISVQPQNQSPAIGGNVSLSVTATGAPTPTFQWQRNGTNIVGATNATLTLANIQPADAGIYHVTATNANGSVSSQPAIVAPASTVKLVGTGQEFPNIAHPNGNIFDQILIQAAAITITADSGQAVRISFIDLTNDIVQVEFSGAGALTLILDNPSGPAAPTNYNQPATAYMKGHPSIVISGANQTTNVGVFSVGRATAFDPTGAYNILAAPSATNVAANNGSSLFAGQAATVYDGLADVALIAIASSNGQFGGIRSANASFFATKGLTGVYAPGVQFAGPMFISDLNATDTATPVLRIAGGPDTRITGGDLQQANGKAVQVSGLTQLKFTAGGDSHGNALAAKNNQAQLEQNGVNVTTQIVVNP